MNVAPEVIDFISVASSDPADSNPIIVRFDSKGPPYTEKRARKDRQGLFYTSNKKTREEWKAGIKEHFPETIHGPIIYGASVPLKVTFGFCIYSRKKIWGTIRSMTPCVHPNKPDIDNLAKFALHAMNGVIYSDDKHIVHLLTYKVLVPEGKPHGYTKVQVGPFAMKEAEAELVGGMVHLGDTDYDGNGLSW